MAGSRLLAIANSKAAMSLMTSLVLIAGDCQGGKFLIYSCSGYIGNYREKVSKY